MAVARAAARRPVRPGPRSKAKAKAKATPAKPQRKYTRGERVVLFIETYCRIPEGKMVGQAVKLRDWQKREILEIYDTPDVNQVVLTVARKNGKSALIAMLMLAHIFGPVAVKNSQIYSAAQSRDQAAIVFKLMMKMIFMNPLLEQVARVSESMKEIRGTQTGVFYKALAAEASTTYGLSPVLVVHDELGQVRGPTSPLYDALETAMGAHDRTLSIIISTQAPTDQDLLSTIIDDAVASGDPRVKLIMHCAEKDDDPWAEATWFKANPALGDFLSLENFRSQAEKAKRLPAQEAAFLNLKLNMRVSMTNALLTSSVWARNSAAPDRDLLNTGSITLGLDLSARQDLTALVASVADSSGDHHIFSWFWTPANTLRDREQRDRAPYSLWVKQGYLLTTPGVSVDYSFIAQFLAETFGHRDVEALRFDRWRIQEFKRELERVGYMPSMKEHGQGFKDMGPAVDQLEHLALEGRLRHGDDPVLTSSIANTVVTRDPAGNRKPDKARASGRIDGAVALMMALAPSDGDVPLDIDAMIG